VLSNLSNGALQRIVPDLGAMLLRETYQEPRPYYDVPAGEQERESFAGSWSCRAGLEFTISGAGERLDLYWMHGAIAQPLWGQPDRMLFYPQDWSTISRDRTNASRLRYETLDGRVSNGTRIRRAPKSDECW
jgi:hypothetical protein